MLGNLALELLLCFFEALSIGDIIQVLTLDDNDDEDDDDKVL